MRLLFKTIVVFVIQSILTAQLIGAENYPKSIRFGLVGNPYNKPFVGGLFGYADEQRLFNKEFEKEGINIQYVILTGTGPAINEAIANGTVDIASYGDLVGVVGKAGGLKTKVIAIAGGTQETYVVGPADSPIRSFDELKGKKVGLLRGTYLHLSFNKFLKDHGYSEKDFKIYNLQAADGLAAITAKTIDAYVGASNFLDLVDQGIGKITFTTNSSDAPDRYKGFSEIVVTEDFEKKYPVILQRVVNVIVKANEYLIDEAHRSEYLRLGAKNGTPFRVVKRDLGNKSLRWVNGLSVDKDAVALLRETVNFALETKIIRKNIDVNLWVEPKYLSTSYKDLGIEDHWVIKEHYLDVKK